MCKNCKNYIIVRNDDGSTSCKCKKNNENVCGYQKKCDDSN